jgi:hypothetical protein
MEPERRRQLVLVVLMVVLAIAIYRVWPRPAAPPTAASNARGAARPAAGAAVTAPDVKLEALQAERPKPHEGSTRNLFRFRAPPAPPPSERPQPPPSAPQAPPRQGGVPGPTVPPIPLKFIATMTVGGRLMAVLAEGSGREPVSGFEGDTILGQYRIVRIGPESIELTYLDGRGRQTIRFSGS